jgi:putative ABC transport system substrate-binding protein
MQRRTVRLVVMLILLLTLPFAAHTQPATKVYRLGFVRPGTASVTASETEAFTQRLRELGYTEGHNLIIEARYAQGQLERLPALVAEVVRLQVDCLAVGGTEPTRLAKQATRTIPIVMLNASDDPVRLGLIASLARPGGNVTGVIDSAEQLAGKRLALLKEAVPHLVRVGHLAAATDCPPCAADLQEVQAAARELGVRVQPLPVHGPDDFAPAFRAARAEGAEALIIVNHGFLFSHRERIVQLVDTLRVPVMYTRAEFVQIGGLMSYADDPLERARRAATFVDKILKGAQPADLPVERPTKFELVINLKAAQALGLTLPPTLLFQADKVIH